LFSFDVLFMMCYEYLMNTLQITNCRRGRRTQFCIEVAFYCLNSSV